MIEDAIRAVLVADAGVSALVATRVWPDKLPQAATLPAVVMQVISSPRDVLGLEGSVGMYRARIQLTVWGTTRGSVSAVESAIDSCLQGKSGLVAGYGLRLVKLLPWSNDYEVGPPERFGATADAIVHSREGVAA